MNVININEASAKELLGYYQAKLDEEAREMCIRDRLWTLYAPIVY